MALIFVFGCGDDELGAVFELLFLAPIPLLNRPKKTADTGINLGLLVTLGRHAFLL
jgi:hypothetical protein